MTDKKNILTDQELDMITGGKTTCFILPGEKDGTYTTYKISGDGDIAKMQQCLQQGGDISSLHFTGSFSKSHISNNDLEKYIKVQQGRGYDVISYINK